MNEALGPGIFCDAGRQLGRHGTYECQNRWGPDVEGGVMAPESISRKTAGSLQSKVITPDEALQWVIEKFGIDESIERLENEISFEREVFHRFGQSQEDAKLHREHVRPYEQARDQIVSETKQAVIRALRSGHFIGIGLKMPIVANSVSGFIVPVFWNVLELDFDRMIATSEDMEYRNVQIIPIDRCTEEEVRAIDRRLNALARPDPLDAHAGHPAPGTSTDDELPMKSAPAEEGRESGGGSPAGGSTDAR